VKQVGHLIQYLQHLRLAAHQSRSDANLMLRPKFVEGRGSLTPSFIIVEAAPRGDDEMEGRPFVGKVGSILDTALAEARLSESDAWFTSILKFRPAKTWALVEPYQWQDGERAPNKEELSEFDQAFSDEVDSLKPTAIVACGKVACEFFAGREVKMTQERGAIVSWRTYGVILTVHPAYILHRGNSGEQDFKNLVGDLKQVRGLIKQT